MYLAFLFKDVLKQNTFRRNYFFMIKAATSLWGYS